MTYEEAKTRLLNHANLPESMTRLPPEESLVFNLWKADRERAVPGDLDRLYEDVLGCLQIVNHALNGPVPSGPGIGRSWQIETPLVYALWIILDEGWEYYYKWEAGHVFGRPALDQLARINRSISCAWGGVLAGDIDSLREHVELEGKARGPVA